MTLRENILDVLRLRFGKTGKTIETAISQVQEIDTLKHLLQNAIGCESLDVFRNIRIDPQARQR